MNRIAASPLMTTTGEYCSIASERGRRLLGHYWGKEPEVPSHCDQIGAGESSQEARQS